MRFISTRNNNASAGAPEAIIKGISDEGGLFVPEAFPLLSMADIMKLLEMPYYKRAACIMGYYLTDFSQEELLETAKKAYLKFGVDTVPLKNIKRGVYSLELWHGPTHAFKDIALTVLPYLLTASKKKTGNNDKTLVIVATSGDTGKAALEGFKNVEGTGIIVFYPESGVSNLQKLQMITQRGNNVKVYGIKGNFDDAQTAVKNVFADKEINAALKKQGYALSSANSINIGRLLPQIAYYFSAYLDLIEHGEVKPGDKINFCVPSGNFGNILAGFYAYKMGLPVNKLICASNRNNVLTDFFHTGEYDADREFYKTISPSMDILVSSNLERLIYELSGRNDGLTRERMNNLRTGGKYKITKEEKAAAEKIFYAGYADEDDVKISLANTMGVNRYLTDPHTAVGINVYESYKKKTGDETATVILSTASPVKFAEDVLSALKIKAGDTPLKSLKKLSANTGLVIPGNVAELETLPVLHKEIIAKDEAGHKVLEFAKKNKKEDV